MQEGDEGVVVSVGVQDDDGLVVDPEVFPGDDLEEFFHRAAASGQGDRRIGELGHPLLAFVHGVHRDALGQAGVAHLAVDQEAGDNAGDRSAGCQGCV